MGKVYICPMHPEIMQKEPGFCPKCGMRLISNIKSKEKVKHQFRNKHVNHTIEMFLRKFWISLILTIPVIIYSELPQRLFGWQAPQFPGVQYFSLLLSSIIFFYGGQVFIIGAIRELKAKLPGMMTLIALAISVAYLYSTFIIIIGRGHALFWELTTLITVMLLGHWMEMKAIQGAQSALKELSKLLPDTAEVIRENKIEIVPLPKIKVNDIVLVRPGVKIPADGIVIGGKSEVNEAMVTGESKPINKEVGNEVIAGTINGDGSLKVKVLKIGEKTFLAGIRRLVTESQTSKSRLQMLSDKAALYLTIIAIGGSILTFISWILVRNDLSFAFERLVAVLVVVCPHALGLAIPLVVSISSTLAARNGLLIRQRSAFETSRKIDIVLFDKTGTLTKGKYEIEKIIPSFKFPISKLLQMAASVDNYSEHFIARAIVAEAKKRNLDLLEVKDFKRLSGKGAKGEIQGSQIYIGGRAILEEKHISISEKLNSGIETLARQGKTIIFVIIDDELAGIIALADLIRQESKEAIQELKKMEIKVGMMTGDSLDVAEWVAKELGINDYFAEVLPEEKTKKVKFLQSQGLKVAMVGDGINDAPALTQADLGIAIGAGTNVAIESAGVILVKNDPRDIVKIFKLSDVTYSKMIQNLFWATGYNIIALPLAAGVFYFKGILLTPALAAIFMSLSTVIVAVNAMFLRRWDMNKIN